MLLLITEGAAMYLMLLNPDESVYQGEPINRCAPGLTKVMSHVDR